MPRSCCYRIEYIAILLRMSSNKPVSAYCYRIEYVAIILRMPSNKLVSACCYRIGYIAIILPAFRLCASP